MLRRIAGPAFVLLLAIGCGNKSKQAEQAAAAKSAEAAEIDNRAKAIAEELVQQAADDAKKQRDAENQQRAEARKALRQVAMDHPGLVLESSKLQLVNDGKRHLTSISLTNNSKFSMSDVEGTLDFHGGPDVHGDDSDVLAHVPVQLTGEIASRSSMVFSEHQHTLSTSSIQLATAPTGVTFTVTSVKLAPDDDSDAPPGADAGGASASTQ
jgi:uncharacterized lipoprotein NlpE involved in copper resistance